MSRCAGLRGAGALYGLRAREFERIPELRVEGSSEFRKDRLGISATLRSDPSRSHTSLSSPRHLQASTSTHSMALSLFSYDPMLTDLERTLDQMSG